MDIFFNIGLYHFLATSVLLFFIGILGVITSKNLIKMIFSVAIMISGITLNLASFNVYCDTTHFKGCLLAFLVIVLSLIYIIIASAIALNIFKFKGSLNTDEIGDLKG